MFGQSLFLLTCLHKLHTNIPQAWGRSVPHLKSNPRNRRKLADLIFVSKVQWVDQFSWAPNVYPDGLVYPDDIRSYFGSVSILSQFSTQVAHQHAPSPGTFCFKFEEKPMYLAEVSRHYISKDGPIQFWYQMSSLACWTARWCLVQSLFLLSCLHN